MKHTNKTRLNMVIGYPLAHTQSPILHNAIYQMMQIDATLLAFANKNCKALIQAIKTLSIELTAVTMPFKEQMVDELDFCSPEIEKLKAVNTIIQRDNKLYGYNTDVDGIRYALRDIPLTNKKVLLIGAGGAARAVAYFMNQHNVQLIWLNRTQKNAENMVNEFGGQIIQGYEVEGISADIIVNTTPLGMFPHVSCSPLRNYQFNAEQVVFDLIYNPLNTELLKQAKVHNATIISGLDMFIGQGIRQIELWLNKSIFSKKLIEQVKEVLIKSQIASTNKLDEACQNELHDH